MSPPRAAVTGGAMQFVRVIAQVGAALDAAGVRYALIGGFAMALRGVQRATLDLDFLLALDDLDRAHRSLCDAGYQRRFHSDNVSHYRGAADWLGRIDLLHAFRSASLGMLGRAERIALADDLSLPVAQVEDIIGLKVQAAVNDPQRAAADWADIRLLTEAAARQRRVLDWELIADYLDLFGLTDRLTEVRGWYDTADR